MIFVFVFFFFLMFKRRIMVVLRLMRNEKFWGFLGREALGSWVRELRAGLDLGFLDFLFVFSLGKTVRLAGAKSSHHSIATVSF